MYHRKKMTSIKVLAANDVSAGAERVNTRSMEAMLMLNRLCSTGLRTTCYYAVAPFSNCKSFMSIYRVAF